MCADFVQPQFQNPDFLAAALKGQALGQNAQAFPGQMQLQQQQVQSGQLNLDQLRQMMGLRQQAFQSYQQTMQGLSQPNGGQSTQTGQQPGGGDGGIQNGPQGAVSAPPVPSNDPLAPYLDPRRIAANASYGQFNAMMSGKDANEPVANALKLESEGQAYGLKNAQIRSQLQGSPLVTLQAFAANPNAADALLRPENSGMFSKWPVVAQRYGLDPKDLSNINVRMAATLAANEQRAALQMPLLPMPVGYRDVEGPYGQHLQVQVGGETPGKETEITGQKPPTYTPEISQNPRTGQKQATMLQTSPGGAPAPSFSGSPNRAPVTSPGSGGVGTIASAPVDVGFAPPNAENLKAAGFAQYARSSIPALAQMESAGYRMSPTNRAAVVDAATNDDPGRLSQWVSQETLANKLSGKDQEYMANLMPLLQAAGHSMSGMRLTSAAMRQGFESLIPVDSKDSKYISTVAGNRQNIYRNLLGQSGSAVQMPEFSDTLGRDHAMLSLPKTNAQGWKLHKDAQGNAAYVSPDGKQFAEVGGR